MAGVGGTADVWYGGTGPGWVCAGDVAGGAGDVDTTGGVGVVEGTGGICVGEGMGVVPGLEGTVLSFIGVGGGTL